MTKLHGTIQVLLLGTLLCGQVFSAESTPVYREYQVKAAFLYNYLKTVEWPQSAQPQTDAPWVIGILGDNAFGDAFAPVINKPVKQHPLSVRPLGHFSTERPDLTDLIERIKQCHILFISASERKKLAALLPLLQDTACLTVSETSGFLEAGGMINFIPGAEKGDFEINLGACQEVDLKLSSKLLQIAVRVTHSDSQSNKP